MKILLIAKPWKGGLGRYFFMALQQMFPGQVEWMPTRPEDPAGREHFRRDPEGWWRNFRTRIEDSGCDAALFIGQRREFRGLKPNPKYVLYLVDDVRLEKGDVDAFGRVFLSDPGYIDELRAAIREEQYGGVLPFAFHPPLHCPSPLARKQGGLCFIGNRDAKRTPYLERLFAEGLRPRVVGNYFLKSALFWRDPFAFRRGIANEAMGKIYAAHNISLNIHARVVREGTNMRTFEGAGYGIPQLVEYRPGIEAYFEPGKEIAVFRDAGDMIKQARLLLDNPVAAKNMAVAARQRALAEHTYYHRIATVFGSLLPPGIMQMALARVT